jgi:predicted RNA binding protein YcfA (HicA-like mRNA interferase family)
MKYHQMRRALLNAGYKFDRQCRGSHEFWANGESRILVTRSGLGDTRAQQNWLKQIRSSASA